MYLGVDPEQAESLSGSLYGISSHASQIGGDLLTAEVLSDLPTGAHPLLDELGATTAQLGAALSNTALQISRFRISLQNTYQNVERLRLPGAGGGHPLHGLGLSSIPTLGANDADRASYLVDLIVAATRAGREPKSLDVTELGLLLDRNSGSDEAVSRVVGLVLDGLPASVAVQLGARDDMDKAFGQVADAIRTNRSPGASGLPVELFPSDYVRWHEIQAQIDELKSAPLESVSGLTFTAWGDLPEVVERQAQIAELQQLRFDLGRDEVPGWAGVSSRLDQAGGAPFAAAGVMVMAHLGTQAAASFGRYLGAAEVDDLVEEIEDVSNVVAGDADIAVGFFSTLGAQGSVQLLFDTELADRATAVVARANFSKGLALASHDPALGFSGAEFIATDSPPIWHYPLGTSESMVHAEMLLLDPSFNVEWLVDAASETFSRAWVEPSAVGWSDQWIDPRLTVMMALINNDSAGSFVSHMDAAGRLHEVLNGRYTSSPAADAAGNGPVRFGELDPHLVPAEPGSVPHVFFAQVGSSLQASRSVINHLATQPDMGRLDLRLANGLSTMLAGVNIDHLEPGAWQEKFFAAYDIVLRSGSGHDVALVGGADVVGQVIGQQLGDRTAAQVDVAQVSQFVARVEAHRFAVFNNNAQLADLAAQNQMDLLELFGFGSGVIGVGALVVGGPYTVAVGSIATVVGFLASLLGKGIDDPDEQLDFLRDEILSNTGRRDELTRQILIAAIDSGRVSAEVLVDPVQNAVGVLPVSPGRFAGQSVTGLLDDDDTRLDGLSIDGVPLFEFVQGHLDADDLIDRLIRIEIETELEVVGN